MTPSGGNCRVIQDDMPTLLPVQVTTENIGPDSLRCEFRSSFFEEFEFCWAGWVRCIAVI